MDKDEAKSRKPPHSATSSGQQLQKKEKFTLDEFPFFGTNIAGDNASERVKESDSGGLDLLWMDPNGQSLATYVLNTEPEEGKPLDVIGAVDSTDKGELTLPDLLHTVIPRNISPTGAKVTLKYHKNPQGDTKGCLWIIHQDVGNEQKILFKGQLVTVPPNRAARGIDANHLPLQIVAEAKRENFRVQKTKALTLETTDGEMLGTLPFTRIAPAVLRTASAKVGSIISGYEYVHTEINDDREEVHTPRTVDIRIRRYTSTDGEIGVTTKLGETVLARPHFVMPREAMPVLPGQSRVSTSLDDLHDYSVAYRASILCSEVFTIPGLETKFVEYLKRLETFPDVESDGEPEADVEDEGGEEPEPEEEEEEEAVSSHSESDSLSASSSDVPQDVEERDDVPYAQQRG